MSQALATYALGLARVLNGCTESLEQHEHHDVRAMIRKLEALSLAIHERT